MMNRPFCHATNYDGSSESLTRKSAPPLTSQSSLRDVHQTWATMINDLCDANTNMTCFVSTHFPSDKTVPEEQSNAFRSFSKPQKRLILQEAAMCPGNSLRDSTDILLRKNSLLDNRSNAISEMTSISSSTHIQSRQSGSLPNGTNQKAAKSAAITPNYRTLNLFKSTCLSSTLSSFSHSPSHHSSKQVISFSFHSNHHQTRIVPLVLAILWLVHSVLSSPVLVNSPKSSNSESTFAGTTTPATPAHINSKHHSHHATNHLQQTPVQGGLNPIELNLLDHLINKKLDHYREFHHKPSRNAPSEHIFDPSSEEITMKLESSARTISASQKRDIHEPMEGIFAPPQSGSSTTNGRMHHRMHHLAAGAAGHHNSHHRVHQQHNSDNAAQAKVRGEVVRALEGAEMTKEIPKWLYWLHPARTHLTLSEAHALVKSVINNGLIEQLDFKTLEHLTRKYAPGGAEVDKDEDFIELHSETSNESSDVSDIGSKRSKIDKISAKFENEEPLNPEEELLTINKPSEESPSFPVANKKEQMHESATDPKQNQVVTQLNEKSNQPIKSKEGQPESAIINEDLFKNYQNLEQVMEILMHSENTLKKRGEGPQLSIDSALTVLRERLMLELARRKAKATQDQIAYNSELLKKLGRRRRSVDERQYEEEVMQPVEKRANGDRKRSRTVNCDETKCNLDDLNTKWSNLRESLYNLANDYNARTVYDGGKSHHQHYPHNYINYHIKPYYYPAPLKVSQQQQRFRNNDKYIEFDNIDSEEDSGASRQTNSEVESQPEDSVEEFVNLIKGAYRNRLTYTGPLERIRINSRKPILSNSGRASSSSAGRDTSSSPYYYRRHPKVMRQGSSSDVDQEQQFPSADDDLDRVTARQDSQLAVGKFRVVQQMK